MTCNQRETGRIEMGLPLMICAVIGGFVLKRYWVELPLWACIISLVAISVLVVAGFVMFDRSKGVASSQQKDDE